MDTRPVGLVLVRAHMPFGLDPFSIELVDGVEEELALRDRNLSLQVVPDAATEPATYARWARDRTVAAVVLLNLTEDDPRATLLRELELPAVALGPASATLPVPHVAGDDTAAVHDAVGHLIGLGHRHLGRVAGPTRLVHTRERTREFTASCRAAGASASTAVGDYTEESGAAATRELLALDPRPTAIVYDNDVMAVAGLHAAAELGLRVPDDLSILAWDDSVACRLAVPPLSAMSLDVHELGRRVGATVLELLETGSAANRAGPDHHFLARASTGPAPS